LDTISRYLVWPLVAVFVFLVSVGCFLILPQSAFRDSYLGNLLATLLGIIIGIPIAWELEKRRQAVQERKDQEAQQQVVRDRKSKVLQRIRGELSIDWDILSAMVNYQRENPLIYHDAGLKDELWSAFCNGGQLQWVDDPEILDAVSFAYHYIKRIKLLEEEYFDPDFKMSVMTISGENTIKGASAAEAVRQLRPQAVEQVQLAIRKIDAFLQN
jgi:hypothetical protein